MKIYHFITLAMALALVLSCTEKSQKDSPAVSGLDNALAETRPETEIDAVPLTKAETAVSKKVDDLSSKLIPLMAKAAEGKSFVFSPLGMQYVLGMAANAVSADKKQEFITGCFGPDADIETINATCSKLISNLPAIDLGSNLSIANIAVAPGDVTFPDLDKDVLSDVFKAPFCRISTGSKTAEYTTEINKWASRHTNGKIDKLLEADNSDYGTGVMIMYLNALYFDSKWSIPFSSCGKKPFNTAEGVTNIDMMATTLRSQFYDNGNFKITCIPMGESGKFNMAVLIPEGGIGSIDADTIEAALEAARTSSRQLIELKMPMFNITSSINLVDYLISLGIMESSDFGVTRYADSQGVEGYASLTSLIQRITASVSEDGFEVAAASAESHGAPISDVIEEEIIDVTVDQPFLFFVFEQTSGLKLLSGAFAG